MYDYREAGCAARRHLCYDVASHATRSSAGNSQGSGWNIAFNQHSMLSLASIALHTTRLERPLFDLQPIDLLDDPAPPSGPPLSQLHLETFDAMPSGLVAAGCCPPLPPTPPRCGTFSDHLLCVFAVATPTTNATTQPLRFAHLDLDRACMARSDALRAHVLASGADLLWRSPASPEIPPGCRAAAVAMRDETCGLREGCAVRACTVAGFPIEAARTGRRRTELSAELPWGVGSGQGRVASRGPVASTRTVAVAPPERDAAAAAVAAVEEQPPAYIQEALRHDLNVLNGLPGEWPGV